MNINKAFLLFSFLFTNINAANNSIMKSNYIYTPELTTEYKNMSVDDSDITVVVENRFVDTKGAQIQLILYKLDKETMSLIWKTEDTIWATAIDSQITQSGIYVLHNIRNMPYKTAISKFSSINGELLWRKGVGIDSDKGQFLRVNKDKNMIIVAGENQEISQIWRYDNQGELLSHMSMNIAIAGLNNPPDFEDEILFELYIHDDNSLVLLAIMERALITRVIHISSNNAILFDHAFNQIQLAFLYNLNLSVSTENSYLITLLEESLFGVPRFVQYQLNENGVLQFVNKTGNLLQWGVDYIISDYLNTDTILNVTDVSISGPVDINVFHTESDGQFSDFFNYIYKGVGLFIPTRNSLITKDKNLFIIAGKSNTFPDTSIDNIYLQWGANGQICLELIDQGSDYTALIKSHNNYVYELRYRGDFVVNGRHLQIIKYPRCSDNYIFRSGFE